MPNEVADLCGQRRWWRWQKRVVSPAVWHNLPGKGDNVLPCPCTSAQQHHTPRSSQKRSAWKIYTGCGLREVMDLRNGSFNPGPSEHPSAGGSSPYITALVVKPNPLGRRDVAGLCGSLSRDLDREGEGFIVSKLSWSRRFSMSMKIRVAIFMRVVAVCLAILPWLGPVWICRTRMCLLTAQSHEHISEPKDP